MPTIKDVARHAGVSIATVSRVLNDTGFVSPDLEQRVRKAVSETGYRPNAVARNLRRNESVTLGMLVPDNTNPFFAEVAKGVEDHCFERGYTVVLCNTGESPDRAERYITTLFEHRVAGFIIISPAGLRPHIQRMVDEGYPIVVADRLLTDISTDAVVSNNRAGARDAMAHLLGLGHRRIGLIVGNSPLGAIQSRIQGVEEALGENGLAIDPELTIFDADYLAPAGYAAAEALLCKPNPPTAIFAFNDLMAFGVLNYAYTHHIAVPQELSVVGFDDIAVAEYSVPPLTTVAQPKYDLGKVVAELLVRRIQGDEQPPVTQVLPTRLVVRQSTAQPNAMGP
jgi:LacI family transcriptional regulator